MSIVVWDGKVLAADGQTSNGLLAEPATKIFELGDGGVAAFTGTYDVGLAMVAWARNDGAKWPAAQETDRWSRLTVASPDRTVRVFEQEECGIPLETTYGAWGSGRDFALGAIAMGADAVRAVQIASKFCVHCGFGGLAYDVELGIWLKT